MSKRPNLVFIHNDHQALLQWRQSPVKPQRRAFARVAGAGVEFDNAYCATPLCGPTRRTLLHGLYAHTHQQYYNDSEVPYTREVYLETLADAGYDSWYFGKWHAGPGCALDFKTRGLCQTDYGNPYLWEDYKAYCRENNLPEARFAIRHVLGPKIFGYGQPGTVYEDLVEGNDSYQCKDDWCGEHAAGILTTPKETHEAFYLAHRACQTLRRLAAEGGETPFSLRVDFWGPHQPFFPTQEYYDMYKDVQFPEYPNWDSPLTGKPPAYHRERNHPIGRDNRLIIPNARPWSYYNDLLRHCAGHISLLDDAAGLILDTLEELGLLQDTCIVYTTDHGDALACHGGHFDKASFMSEEVTRIPMAMAWPGHIPAGTVCSQPVCSVSVPATLLDAAGLAFAQPVHGPSLLPLAQGRAAEWPDYAVCETHGHGFGEYITSRAIVSGTAKYVATLGEEHGDELYDLAADPYELHNLIGDEAHADTLAALRSKLRQWQRDTEDPVVFPWAAGAE